MGLRNSSKICLFIPCYNVDHAILRVLESIPQALLERIGKIFIIDNGSTDATVDMICGFIAKRQGTRFELYQNQENYTLGGSTILALSIAIAQGFDFLICFHGDGQGSVEDLESLMNESKEGVDLVLGSRLMEESRVAEYSRLRLFGNRFFARVQSLILGRTVGDIGAIFSINLKTISRFSYDALPYDMGYQPILILTALIRFPDLLLCEIPISWGPVERSNVDIFRYALIHSWRLVCLLLRVPLRSGKFLSDFKTKRKLI